MSAEYECCVATNAKLQKQIDNQKEIINSLEDIEHSILLSNDTLKHSVKFELDNHYKEIETKEEGCDLCSIIGAILGAIISGGIAIFIFWRGRKNEKNKEKLKYIDFGEEVFTLLKNITANSKKQVELLNALVTSITEKPYTHGKYNRVSLNLLKRAQSFDTTYVFTTFKTLNLEKKSYIKFYSSIDFLLEVFENIDDDYHTNNSEVITPLSNKFLQLKGEIMNICSNFIESSRRENKTTEAIYTFINQLLIDYHSPETLPDKIDLKYDVDKIIRPLKSELLAKYRDNDISIELLNLSKQAGDFYKTILIESSNLRAGVNSQLEPIGKMITYLDSIEQALSSNYAS
ncbi:hypothetical protein BZG02_16025 [Labilibaculum filiforme]|uniref:Uncharacterized protein n=2 Tax=Labilibaculum filiforme TaxID=1940526 RepID=A0A2N3HTC1_9BACT|nr:hypothetical protein BZG02_16025 [Labilibaculum filiforme]